MLAECFENVGKSIGLHILNDMSIRFTSLIYVFLFPNIYFGPILGIIKFNLTVHRQKMLFPMENWLLENSIPP